MINNNPLDQLRSNHLPDPVSFWPPAPGWWILAIVLLLIIGFGCFQLYKWHKKRRYRQIAAQEVVRLYERYQQNKDAKRFAGGCNQLLKRTALRAYPNSSVASLYGDQWLDFLDKKMLTKKQLAKKHSNKKLLNKNLLDKNQQRSVNHVNNGFLQGSGNALGDALYDRHQKIDVKALYSLTLSWIKKHHV